MPEPMSGCWLWTAYCNENGYGQFFFNKKQGLAHRFSYQHFVGEIPDDLELDHLCRTRCCVNPAHLEPVTTAENIRRGVMNERRKQQAASITHCPAGHPYEGENLQTWRGMRACKECKRQRQLAKIRKRAEAEGRKLRPPAKDRTHCPAGHPYAGENLRIARNGQRVCKTCQRRQALKCYHARRQNPA